MSCCLRASTGHSRTSAITLAGRVAVNLNFTAGAETMTRAAADCGVRVVITSRTFAADAPTLPDLAILYLEGSGRGGRQARASARLRVRPFRAAPPARHARLRCGCRLFERQHRNTESVALTHYNLLANIEAMAQLFPITPADRVAGVLPFFHPFGFTLTVWFPLVAGCGVVYHPNPADARGAGDLVEKYRATLLLSTPTFCANYTRKVSSEQFASLRYVLVAGEKLHNAVATAFREKFGLTLLEGYGCAEMGRSSRSIRPVSNGASTRRSARSPEPSDSRCPASPPASWTPRRSSRCRPTPRASFSSRAPTVWPVI